ncbi:hypothetical protein BDB00DRAFT_783272 [Zychaea mexicana]|uniref:uncharacterized protein n=1 Tax=Zychaea mexicana TaxID=64656 RepID=UPI0022FEAA20|nr:uncharacterized protein BDB00DRAFT_783272 [Zychaea mexicana]KAI9499184.1 hypothetical protein BDB00DRAFT_783272 [Zychaea mexicana]
MIDTSFSSPSIGDAPASSTTAAVAQTEEEPTATTASTDRVGQKHARQAEVPEHTDGSNDNGANMGQSENQSTGKSGQQILLIFSAVMYVYWRENPKTNGNGRLSDIFFEPARATTTTSSSRNNECTCGEEERTENAYERTQLSAQRALNEQSSPSASLPLVRKRALENDSDESEKSSTAIKEVGNNLHKSKIKLL